MRVVFLDDVENVARAGDVKDVATGFARNYLIPKGLAALATADHLQRIERIKAAAAEKRAKEQKDMQSLAERLSGLTVTVKAKVGPTGEYYGSITPAAIAQEASNVAGVPVDRKLLALEAPVDKPGEYEVQVKLSQGISATIKVIAEAE